MLGFSSHLLMKIYRWIPLAMLPNGHFSTITNTPLHTQRLMIKIERGGVIKVMKKGLFMSIFIWIRMERRKCLFGTVVKGKSLESKLYDKLIYLKIKTFSFWQIFFPFSLYLYVISNCFMASLLNEAERIFVLVLLHTWHTQTHGVIHIWIWLIPFFYFRFFLFFLWDFFFLLLLCR